MGEQIGDCQRIAKSRKEAQCSWCGEAILVGEPAVRWLWKDAGVHAVRTHPECFDNGVCEMDHGEEWIPGDYARGCLCEHGCCQCEGRQ